MSTGFINTLLLYRELGSPGLDRAKAPRPRCWVERDPTYYVIMSDTSEDLEISLSVGLSVSTLLAFGLAICEKGRGGGSPAGWSWPRADLPQHRSLEKGLWSTAPLLGTPLALSIPASEHLEPRAGQFRAGPRPVFFSTLLLPLQILYLSLQLALVHAFACL